MAVQNWTLNYLVKLRRYQPEMVDQALDTLLAQQPDLQWAIVVSAYLEQEINLGKAAELLGLHRLELQQRFATQGIPLRLGPDTIDEVEAELAAINAWNDLSSQGQSE